jgi:hypothetical protein
VVSNPLKRKGPLSVTLEGRNLLADQTWKLDLDGGEVRQEIRLQLGEKLPTGRHVFTLRAVEGDRIDPADAFLAVDLE